MQKYLERLDVRTIAYDAQRDKYTYWERGVQFHTGGLHSYLERTYHPHIDARTRKRRRGGGSSKKIGLRVDRELGQYGPRPRAEWTAAKLHDFTRVILDVLSREGHRVCASQVPVRLRRIGRVTCADLICKDDQGRLWMYEIKTGGMRDLNRANGNFKGRFSKVPCTEAGRYELQRHFTHQALVDEGLPLVGSRVIVARKIRGKDGEPARITCKIIPNASWIL